MSGSSARFDFRPWRRLDLVAVVVLATATVDAAATAAGADVIYQAFDEPFAHVQAALDRLTAAGVTDVLVSPAQKSIDGDEWWKRYQPVDFSRIEGPLGDADDLRRLAAAAHARGLRLIVDVVLNHMADDRYFPDLRYPQFGPEHFHHPTSRPCITNFADREQATHNWLCDFRAKLPDLDTGHPHVRAVQRDYLQRLLALGVDGFRIDAAVNIETGYFDWLLPQLGRGHLSFGEVVGTSLAEVRSYAERMPVTDFFLLRKLIRVFGYGGDLRQLRDDTDVVGAAAAVRIVRTHDALNNPDFFAFGEPQDALLAYAYILARAGGTAFVYRDDLTQPLVAAGLRFRHALAGADERFVALGGADQLLLARGRSGLVIINKAADWLRLRDLRAARLAPGRYRELVYGFEVEIDADGAVAAWGEPGETVVSVGPRSALFLVRQSD